MEISQFYDVNKRTQTEQVLKNMEDIKDLQDKDTEIEQSIADETQARTEADETLAYDIADLQEQVNSFGNVFTLKGSVATISDLPATNNNVGDVWYVEAEAVGYVWIDDNGTERWEQLGMPVDLSNYVTTTDLATTLEDYQGKLTAGTNVSIIGNTISATQPDISKVQTITGITDPSVTTEGVVGQQYLNTNNNTLWICTAVTTSGDVTTYYWAKSGAEAKQNKLTAGTNVSISNDVISASGGLTEVKASDVNSESATVGQVLTADGSGGASFENMPAPSNVVTTDENNSDMLTNIKTLAFFPSSQTASSGLSIRTIFGNITHFINIYPRGFRSQANPSIGFGNSNIGDMCTIVCPSINALRFYDNSGHYITLTIPDNTSETIVTSNKVPDAPSTDGTYTLKCVVSNGGATKTYQWVLDTQSSNLPVPDNTASGPSD